MLKTLFKGYGKPMQQILPLKLLRWRSAGILLTHPSICTGIIIGNAEQEPLSEMRENYQYREHPLVRTLAERGALPLFEEAVRHGLAEDKDGYVSKCQLCFVARTFFRKRGLYADEVGPDEVYGG